MTDLAHDSVSAGFPSPAEGHMEGPLDLHELMIQHPAATFFVRVDGDSMIDAQIHTGDLLVVDRSLDPTDGRIVVAVVDGEFTVKRLVKEKGLVYLKAENRKYPPMKVTTEMDFQVWGVVTWVIHKA